jgi:ABC-type amino acid transport substrate-binding protein
MAPSGQTEDQHFPSPAHPVDRSGTLRRGARSRRARSRPGEAHAAGNLKINVAFRPIGRKEIAAALLDGRGDIAAASLTVTPERLAQFDFSNPTSKNVSEIVVSGPASQPIAAADDLSGREVFVRTSSR